MQTRSDSSGPPVKATGTAQVRAWKKTETSGDSVKAAGLGYVDAESSTFRSLLASQSSAISPGNSYPQHSLILVSN